MKKEKIAIIGLGKAGTAIGYHLRRAGHAVVAVTSRSRAALKEFSRYTGGETLTAGQNAEAARRATCVFITTPDDRIAPVCREVARQGGFRAGVKVVHMSGAGGLDLLEPARRAGAQVACIHPIQSFADCEAAIRNLPGSTFGITADPDLAAWAAALVQQAGGIPFTVPESAKPLYHAAACLASNYLTTLIHMAQETYATLGLERQEALRTFWPLVEGTLKNIERSGTVQALTGPISRGDAGTIAQHGAALAERLPAYLPAYRELGLLTLALALEKKSLSAKGAEAIRKTLAGADDPQADRRPRGRALSLRAADRRRKGR